VEEGKTKREGCKYWDNEKKEYSSEGITSKIVEIENSNGETE